MILLSDVEVFELEEEMVVRDIYTGEYGTIEFVGLEGMVDVLWDEGGMSTLDPYECDYIELI